MFSSPIMVKKVDLNTHLLKEYCYAKKSESDGRTFSNYGGWQSEDISKDMNAELSKLFVEINIASSEMREMYQVKQGLPFGIQHAWININKKHDFNFEHEHPGGMFSGVYYVKTPDNCGNLEFIHPNRLIDIYFPPEAMEEINLHNATSWGVVPESNNIVMFPSHIRHRVMPSQSDEDRISIAFNMGFL